MIKSNSQNLVDDLWDIQRLFVYFNNQDGFISISDENELGVYAKDTQTIEERKKTLNKIKGIIKNWGLIQDLKLSDEKFNKFFNTHVHNSTIRTQDIRRLYWQVIQANMVNVQKDSFAACSVGAGDFDRIVLKTENMDEVESVSPNWVFSIFGENQLSLSIVNLSDRIFGNESNKKVRNSFKFFLEKEWGEEKITRVLKRHAIDLDDNSTALRVHEIRKIYASLPLLKEDDIKDAFDYYKKFRREEEIPQKLKNKFTEHKENLRKILGTIPLEFKDLNREQVFALIQAIQPSRNEIELNLLGNRIEGLVVGHRGFFDIYRYFHSDLYEDTEISQVYQEVFENQEYESQDKAELYFHELGTKLLVKKEGSQFVTNDLENRLIPGPNGEWYKIVKTTNKWGKFTVFLEPMSKDREKELVIWQCSTAWSWSSSKNLSSMLNNLNPFAPPGYLSGVDFTDEIESMNLGEYKKVTISGHSLGGSFAQRTLIEFAKSRSDYSHVKSIKLVTFDSPGIKEKEDKEFKAIENVEVDVEHYFSYHDVVPFSGEIHLGSNSNNEFKSVNGYFLSPIGRQTAETSIHPHTSYWLRYYNRLKNVTFKKLTVDELRNFGKLHNPFFGNPETPYAYIDFRSYIIDPARKIGGSFAAPFMYPLVWIQETGMGYGVNIKNKIAKVIRYFFPAVIPTSTT